MVPVEVVEGSHRWVVGGGAFVCVRGAGLVSTRMH